MREQFRFTLLPDFEPQRARKEKAPLHSSTGNLTSHALSSLCALCVCVVKLVE